MKKIIFATALTLAMFILNSCGEQQEIKSESGKEFPVKIAVVEKAMVDQVIEFTGNIEPMVKNYISSAAA